MMPAAASRLYSRQTNQSGSTNQFNRRATLRFDECKDIDEVLRLAIKNIDNNFLPSGAIWTLISRLLSRRERIATNTADLVQWREQQLTTLFQHTMSSLGKMKIKDLTTVTLSIAKIVKCIREASQTRTMNVNHQALGRLLQKSNPFGHFAVAADRKLIEFDPRQLSNLAYAYALVGYNPRFDEGSNLFQKIGDRSIICIDHFNSQDLSNLLWAYATLDYVHTHLFEAVGVHIVQSDGLTSFNPQDIAIIVWAYAKLDEQNAALFQVVGDHMIKSDDLAAFKPQDLANIIWAYAKINTNHPVLFKQIGDYIVGFGGFKPFIPQDLAIIVWAYAKVGEHHPDLFKTIGHSIAAVNNLGIFDTQHLTNIAWAYSMAEIDAPFLFNERFRKALLERQHQFNRLDLMQLYQWHVWQVVDSNDGLPSPLKEKCIDAYSRSVKS
jgi:hypothetical protein